MPSHLNTQAHLSHPSVPISMWCSRIVVVNHLACHFASPGFQFRSFNQYIKFRVSGVLGQQQLTTPGFSPREDITLSQKLKRRFWVQDQQCWRSIFNLSETPEASTHLEGFLNRLATPIYHRDGINSHHFILCFL